jgi:hypothetical protein
MGLPTDLDHDKLCEAALAILGLTMFEEYGAARVWKGMDWDLMDALYERGWIDDPKGKAKSVILNEEGEALAKEFLRRHFARGGTPGAGRKRA